MSKTYDIEQPGGILTDRQIRDLCPSPGEWMIFPFVSEQVRVLHHDLDPKPGEYREPTKVISYGLSSMGYDITLSAQDFKVFSPVRGTEIDPKNFDVEALVEAPARGTSAETYFLIPPNSYALGHSVEYFQMPEDVLGICMGKSTYARSGLIVNTTPLEPGWKGRLVLELANSTPLPLRVYANEGIAQVMFFQSGSRPLTTYGDRSGKYQGQQGLVTARV